MADIAIVWRNGRGNLSLNGPDLLTDNSIATAVTISLFTDRRAQPSDPIPDGTTDRRGWWADSFRRRPVGSRLWLLNREKTVPAVVESAAAYADEALAWLKPAGLVKSVTCTATRTADNGLRLSVSLVLPDGTRQPMVFEADLKGF